MTFSRAHFSMLIKYIGISFITGAISHGFFSGTRSLLTGVIGVIFFIIGTILEEGSLNNGITVLAGALLAIAIGSVTGGLQHFPDSPERSLFIIPVGYFASLWIYAYVHKFILTKKEYRYMIGSSIVMLMISIGIFFFIENSELSGHSHIENTQIK